MIHEVVNQGMSVRSVYLDVLQPVQREVGALVADERDYRGGGAFLHGG